MSGEGEVEPFSDKTPDAGCIVQRVVIRPGSVRGAHEIVRRTADAAADVLEIGVAAPRGMVRHFGHLVSPKVEEVSEVPPE